MERTWNRPSVLKDENRKIVCFIMVLLLCLTVITGSHDTVRGEETDPPAGRSLLLIYFLGYDLEESSGAASKDIHEIIRATRESPVLVRIFLGGSVQWWLPFAEERHSYEVEIGNGTILTVKDLGDVHAGEEMALEQFISRAAEDITAGQLQKDWVDLILWGHGLPGLDGIGVDALHEEDSLSLPEIGEALKKCGVKIRLFGFDACRMATLQAAWIIAPFADIFAGSIYDEALEGWNYRNMIQTMNEIGGNTEDERKKLMIRLRENGLQGSDRKVCMMGL